MDPRASVARGVEYIKANHAAPEEKPPMYEFEVALELAGEIDSRLVDAAYYQYGTVGLEEFLLFRDDEKQVVFTIPKRCVGYIRRGKKLAEPTPPTASGPSWTLNGV